MSIARLTADERASYLIGSALRRVMLDMTAEAATREAAWAGYVAACDHGMTSAEAVDVPQGDKPDRSLRPMGRRGQGFIR